jgi:transposase
MIPDAIEVRLSRKARAVLEARLRAATTEQRQLLRIKIVLEAADGFGKREIARELETTPTTVSLWRGRYARERLDELEDLPRSGAPAIYSATTDERIRAVLSARPATTQGFRTMERAPETRASWLNQVECWFSILQGQSLADASFTSVEQLMEHIDAFIETYNKTAEPFVWTKSKVYQRRVKGRRLSEL